MKKILAITILFSAFSCMENDQGNESLTAQREKAIAVAIGTANANRIYVVTKVILNREHNEASPLLKEAVAVNKSTGKKSLVFINVFEQKTLDAGRAAPCGSIGGGWMLANDGCWYHGTVITACSGEIMFIQDMNPYGDNYIGNEPKCMSDDEFDSIA